RSGSDTVCEQLESPRAMRKRMLVARLPAVFLVRRHLAEGALMTVRLEHRIIAEAQLATWRPHQMAVYLTAEIFGFTVREAEAEHRDEEPATLLGRGRTTLLQLVLDLLHRGQEIARTIRLGRPVGCVDTGLAAQRFHA